MPKSFRDLYVWQSAIELAAVIIEVTDGFPLRHRRVLVEQMQRCAVSISSNIAEGGGRLSVRDFRRHLGIARGSLCELETQICIARRIGLLDHSQQADLDRRTALIGAGLNRLIASLHE